MDWLDKAIEAVSPSWAVQRAQNRLRLRNYRLSSDSTLRRIVTDRGGAHTITERDQAKLKDWGRHLARNNPTVQAVCRELSLRCSHFEMVPMARDRNGELAQDFNDELAGKWLDFRDRLELTGALTYRQLRQAMGHSYVRDGEVYLQPVLGSKRLAYRSELPLALQALESDYLPIHYTQDNPRIIQGVEVTAGGVIRAYHVYKAHPSESLNFTLRPSAETIRIPAANMLSLLHVERLGQLRGVSMLAPGGETSADLDEYLEAERVAMKFASTIGLQIVRAPDMATPTLNTDNQRQIDFEPGMVLDQLQPGERAEMLSHDRPGSQFAEFLKQGNRAIAAGAGVNYSAITNDFDGSYSSQRQMLVTAQAWYEHQQQLQIQRIDKPIHSLFLQSLALAGQLPRMRGVDTATLQDADFIAPAMPWIDPAKEATADQTAVQAGFESRAGIIRKRGGNVSRINRELQADDFQAATPAEDADSRAASV